MIDNERLAGATLFDYTLFFSDTVLGFPGFYWQCTLKHKFVFVACVAREN